MSSQQPTDVTPIEDWNRLLAGKVAVVTGGGDGIGGAVSRLFAEHGALVEIAEIDPERAERKRAEIEAGGGTVRAHVVDVTKQADVDRLADVVLSAHGRIDVLINNVGDYRPLVRFQDSSPESWNARLSARIKRPGSLVVGTPSQTTATPVTQLPSLATWQSRIGWARAPLVSLSVQLEVIDLLSV